MEELQLSSWNIHSALLPNLSQSKLSQHENKIFYIHSNKPQVLIMMTVREISNHKFWKQQNMLGTTERTNNPKAQIFPETDPESPGSSARSRMGDELVVEDTISFIQTLQWVFLPPISLCPRLLWFCCRRAKPSHRAQAQQRSGSENRGAFGGAVLTPWCTGELQQLPGLTPCAPFQANWAKWNITTKH